MSADWPHAREERREDPRFATIRGLPWIFVLRAFGLEPRQKGSQILTLPCGFCRQERATIFFISDHRFRCRTCGRTGDAVDFIYGYAEIEGRPPSTAERVVRELVSPSARASR